MKSRCTSPFIEDEKTEQHWILWTQEQPVTLLQRKEQTECRYVTDKSQHTSMEYAPMEKALANHPVIQRRQYNAILSRMNQAAGKTGQFSAWKG